MSSKQHQVKLYQVAITPNTPQNVREIWAMSLISPEETYTQLLKMGLYKCVAVVDVPAENDMKNINDAFEMLNTPDSDAVTILSEYMRSASVGDILTPTYEFDEHYLVLGLGFKNVSKSM